MRVLGISAFYHDSAAALVEDGRVIAAAQEERFTRKKFDANYPRHAIDYCLNHERLKLKDIDYVSFYDKPFLKFERLLETYLAFSPRGFASFRMALPLWLREKLFLKSLLADELKALEPDYDWEKRLVFPEHHLSHAASAFYPSPFEHAAVLTMDGVGEWATTSAAVGHGQNLAIHKEIHFPHSLGLLYAAFTYYTGEFGRIQGHGTRALWHPAFRAADLRQPDRPQAGRLVPAQPRLFQLLHRPDHDQ